MGSGRDPTFRAHENSELGKVVCMLLFILFEASPALAAHMDGSGAIIAMDNYFCSPLLLLCLRQHNIFGVGTLRSNRIGLTGARRFWGQGEAEIKERGDMRVAYTTDARFPLQIVEWVDSRIVMLASTAHVFEGDDEPLEYR